MTSSIRIEGVEIVDKELANIQKIPPQAIRNLAQFVFDRVRLYAGKHTKTGALEQSTYLRHTGNNSWEVGHDAQRAPYARYVHWGSRPHVIKPNKRKSLRWANGGKFIFAKWVNHPGYKGDPWLVRAVTDASVKFESIAARSIREVAP